MLRFQSVIATHWLNRSAGVSYSRVEQSVRVLIAASLPRALRVAEEHIDIGLEREALMVCEFLTSVPRQGFIEFRRKFLRVFDQRIHNRQRVFTRHLHQHDIARMALHQCRDKTCIRAWRQGGH